MNSIFVFVGVAVALASVTSLSTTSPPLLATVVAELCHEVTAEPAMAKVVYNGILTKLNENEKVEENFSNILVYLNNANNEKEFLAGGQDCRQFFAGLKALLLADYEAKGLSSQVAAEKAAQRLADFIAKIQAAMDAS